MEKKGEQMEKTKTIYRGVYRVFGYENGDIFWLGVIKTSDLKKAIKIADTYGWDWAVIEPYGMSPIKEIHIK